MNWWSYVILIAAVQFFETHCIILAAGYYTSRRVLFLDTTRHMWVCPRPVASLPITGDRFPQILDLFQGLNFEDWSSRWLSRENLNFKNNNDWCRHFVIKALIYTILLTLFHRRTTFKMLSLEQSAEKWRFSAGGSSDRYDPPGYRPVSVPSLWSVRQNDLIYFH